MRRRRFLCAAVTLPVATSKAANSVDGAIALVIVAVAGQRPAVRQLQIALRPLQRLDRRLLVDADDDRVLGRRHVEPDHIGGLGDELGIVALAPGFAPGEVDLLRAQEAPDILDIDIAERCSQQRSRPARITLGWGLIQQRQDALVSRLGRVLRLSAPLARFVETRKPLLGIAHAPLRCRAGRASDARPIARLAMPSAVPKCSF